MVARNPYALAKITQAIRNAQGKQYLLLQMRNWNEILCEMYNLLKNWLQLQRLFEFVKKDRSNIMEKLTVLILICTAYLTYQTNIIGEEQNKLTQLLIEYNLEPSLILEYKKPEGAKGIEDLYRGRIWITNAGNVPVAFLGGRFSDNESINKDTKMLLIPNQPLSIETKIRTDGNVIRDIIDGLIESEDNTYQLDLCIESRDDTTYVLTTTYTFDRNFNELNIVENNLLKQNCHLSRS